MRARAWTWLLLALAGLALAVVLSRPHEASAHAVLERSLPVQNQQLSAPPELVEAWYSESLERSLTKLQVLDTEGTPVHTGDTIFSGDPTYAAIAVPASLGPGIYTLSYENVSSVDGHTWAGSFSFIVLLPDGSVPPGTPYLLPGSSQGFLPDWGDNALRWIGLLAAVTMVGASIFALLIARPAADFLSEAKASTVRETVFAQAAGLTVLAAPVVAVAVLGQLVLLADRIGGAGKIDDILFDTRSGQLWLSQLGLAAALFFLFLPALGSRAFRRSEHAALALVPALFGGLGLLITASLGSHAATGGGQFWSIASDFVHYLATAAWLGSLLQLPLVFWWSQRRLEDPQRVLYRANVLDRFSWLAVISVALLIGTGTFNGFVELPNFPSLYETTYGRVLIAKLALIIPLLGVAGLNALVLKPALVGAIDALHGGDRPKGQERPSLEERLAWLQRMVPRFIVLEIVLGVAVLASVSVLTQTTTAEGELRLDASRPSGDFSAIGTADDLTAEFSIGPFGIGVSTFTVRLEAQGGAALGEILGVRLRAFHDDPNRPPTAGVSGTDQDLKPTADPAVWAANAALLTQPGNWRVQARIRRAGAEDEVIGFNVPRVGGILAEGTGPQGLFNLPFTFVDWNIVGGGAMIVLGLGALLIWRNRPPTWQRSTAASVALSSVVSLMAGTTLLFGVHVHNAPGVRTNPVAATADSLAAGEAIYTRNCLSCHGVNGKGSDTAADLTTHVPAHNDGTLFLWISEGIPLNEERKRMPAWKDLLSEADRWNVINYLREAFGSGQFEPVLPATATPAPSAAR